MDRSKLVHPLPRRLWARILLGAAVALAASSAHAYQRTWHTLTISGTPPTSVSAGQSYAFTPTANDSRTRTLVFAIANAPAWANFSSQTGQLTGTPGASSVGTYAGIVIAVSDGSTHGDPAALHRAGAGSGHRARTRACSAAGHLRHATDQRDGRQRLRLPAHGE